MRPTTLRRLLTWQWIGSLGVLLLAFGVVGVIALYVLEDSFIDRRLLAAEQALAESSPLPPAVGLLRPADLPAERRAELAVLPPGALREFRLDDGRYLHLRALTADAQGVRLLVIDAQDELRVNQALRDAALPLLGLLALILLLAAWLARRFVGRIEDSLSSLLPALDGTSDVASLRDLAAKQPVQEFRRFGDALADALQARLDAVQRETETLRFLAHELRTPLQSARLALSSITETGAASPSTQRLWRSLQRLERASAAVLWLGEQTPDGQASDAGGAAQRLCEELAPLAAQRGQTIECRGKAQLAWALPAAAAEAVLGNLLLNAIQHGAPGPILLDWQTSRMWLENAVEPGQPQAGFGLGLELARRLLARIGWSLQCSEQAGRFVVTLDGRLADKQSAFDSA